MKAHYQKVVCPKCGREISKSNFDKHLRGHENHPENYLTKEPVPERDDLVCQFCGRICKNSNSLRQHEIRCKQNPTHIECFGNKGNMPEHTKAFYIKRVKATNGDELDITGKDLIMYRSLHNVCEICGVTLEDSFHSTSKFAPKQLCIDHDHNTKKFRGLLCSRCNRQLGWYEQYSSEITNYLNKN